MTDDYFLPEAIVAIPQDMVVVRPPFVHAKAVASRKEITSLAGIKEARSGQTYLSMENYSDLTKDLGSMLGQVNDEHFHFVLTGIFEPPQLVRGKNNVEYTYDGKQRGKLGMALLLSSTGGAAPIDFTMDDGPSMKPGDAIFWPGTTGYQLKKNSLWLFVTAGGPAFR